MVNVDSLSRWGVSLAMFGFIISAFVIGLDAFQSSLASNSTAYSIIGTILTSIQNMVNQLPTVGTLAGVGVIIAVVAGAFLTLRYAGRL